MIIENTALNINKLIDSKGFSTKKVDIGSLEQLQSSLISESGVGDFFLTEGGRTALKNKNFTGYTIDDLPGKIEKIFFFESV